MNILKFFRRLLSRSTTAASSTTVASAARVGITYSLASGVSGAMAVATVFRCVQVLANAVACLRLEPLELRAGRMQVSRTSPLAYLLAVQPQPERSAYDFWYFAMVQVLLRGNAYIYPRRVSGEVTDLVLCSNDTVSYDAFNSRYTVSDAYNGVFGTFDEADMIHLYIHTSDGRQGESVLSYARRAVGIAQAGDVETGNRFETGGTVRGIVSNDRSARGFGEYAIDQLEKTAETIDDKFSGGDNIVSLPGQVDFKQISLSSADMQFLESRKFTVQELCRFFGVNPSYVFADTSTNYKSAETASSAFLNMTLDPILKRIEAEFRRKLIPAGAYGLRDFRFDRRGIYALDLSSLADYQKKTIEAGIFTINDWRRMENQPAVAGGDDVYISTNLAKLGSDKLTGGAAVNENGKTK